MKLSKASRNTLVAVAVVLVLIVVEGSYRYWEGAKINVVIDNQGTAPIENLSLTSSDGERANLASIAAGKKATIKMGATTEHDLGVSFTQEGNPLNNFEVSGYSPAHLYREGLMLVIEIRPNGEIQRFSDADPDQERFSLKSWKLAIWEWFFPRSPVR